jgi:hypothetical protein
VEHCSITGGLEFVEELLTRTAPARPDRRLPLPARLGVRKGGSFAGSCVGEAGLDERGLLRPCECRRRGPVALDDEIDADPQLPNELRDRHQRLDRTTGLDEVQDDEGSREDDERPTNQPEQGKAGGTKP